MHITRKCFESIKSSKISFLLTYFFYIPVNVTMDGWLVVVLADYIWWRGG